MRNPAPGRLAVGRLPDRPSGGAQLRTIGVEEEYHLVDPRTRAPATVSRVVLDHVSNEDDVDTEIELSMLETRTPAVTELADVRRELIRVRRDAAAAAAHIGVAIAAAGTVPTDTADGSAINPEPRYRAIEDLGRRIAHEQPVCGCHIHVGVRDRSTAIAVANRARPWLPMLLALSTSSPYWSGADTGFASYRTIMWARWPSADIPPVLASEAEYDRLVADLIATGTILDAHQIYWDVRPSERHATVEYRIADVCTSLDDAVLQAALTRALTLTCEREERDREPLPDIHSRVIRVAKWRAARFGVSDQLVDLHTGTTVPARDAIERFVEHLAPALEESGDIEEARKLVDRVLRDGTSADRQRRAFAHAQRITDVIDAIVEETRV